MTGQGIPNKVSGEATAEKLAETLFDASHINENAKFIETTQAL